MQVPVVEVLEASVYDSDPLSNDSCLGVVEVDIAEDVAKVPGGRIYKTWYLEVCRIPPPSLLALLTDTLMLCCVLCSALVGAPCRNCARLAALGTDRGGSWRLCSRHATW